MTAHDPHQLRALTRLLSGAGAGWGLALLARPRTVVAALCPEYPESRLWVVRVLGARLLTQHTAVLTAPEGPVVRAAAVVDLVHAASMVPLLALPRYRRAALISGGIAAAYTAAYAAIAAAAGRSERR
jgi:hypothetical protein